MTLRLTTITAAAAAFVAALLAAWAIAERAPVSLPRLTAGDPAGDDFVRGWYSSHLRSMAEPSLSCGAIEDSYRFVWLRSFHSPVAVRMYRDRDGLVWLVATETN